MGSSVGPKDNFLSFASYSLNLSNQAAQQSRAEFQDDSLTALNFQILGGTARSGALAKNVGGVRAECTFAVPNELSASVRMCIIGCVARSFRDCSGIVLELVWRSVAEA